MDLQAVKQHPGPTCRSRVELRVAHGDVLGGGLKARQCSVDSFTGLDGECSGFRNSVHTDLLVEWCVLAGEATDDDEDSEWSSFDHQGTEGKDTWIELKLDSVKDLSSLVVSWHVPPRKFRVLTKSASNAAWTSASEVIEVFASTYCPPRLHDDQTIILDGYRANCYSTSTGFTSTVQFVRIEIVEFTDESKWVQPRIGEVTARGKAAGTTLPNVFFLEDPPAEQLLGGFTEYDGESFEMAAEVMNLQRSIKVTGDTDGFVNGAKQGLHTMMFGGKMILDHSRVEFCGQRNVLGRYCLHWHHVGHCPDCRFESNAIVDGQTKGLVIHGTHDATANNNVMWNSRGVGVCGGRRRVTSLAVSGMGSRGMGEERSTLCGSPRTRRRRWC